MNLNLRTHGQENEPSELWMIELAAEMPAAERLWPIVMNVVYSRAWEVFDEDELYNSGQYGWDNARFIVAAFDDRALWLEAASAIIELFRLRQESYSLAMWKQVLNPDPTGSLYKDIEDPQTDVHGVHLKNTDRFRRHEYYPEIDIEDLEP